MQSWRYARKTKVNEVKLSVIVALHACKLKFMSKMPESPWISEYRYFRLTTSEWFSLNLSDNETPDWTLLTLQNDQSSSIDLLSFVIVKFLVIQWALNFTKRKHQLISKIMRFYTVRIFSVGIFESKAYANDPKTIDELKNNVTAAIDEIEPQLCENVAENWVKPFWDRGKKPREVLEWYCVP